MSALPLAIADGLASCGHGDEVIPPGPSGVAEFDLVGIATEVGVQRERDEVLVDICWFDLGSGVPPGAVARTGTSRPA